MTGEPYARKPPVRFGGRGDRTTGSPYPYVRPTAHRNSEVQVLAGGKQPPPYRNPTASPRGGVESTGEGKRWPVGERT